MFTLLLADDYETNPRPVSPDDHIIFKDGSVHARWVPQSQEPSNTSVSSDLYHQDQYTDRTAFEFSYGTFVAYEILSPQCSSSDSAIARPKVIEFYDDDEEHSGTFTIVHDCQVDPNAPNLRNVTITVVFPVVDSLSVVFSFRKTCGQGTHELIEFGYYDDPTIGPGQRPAVPFATSNQPLVVGPHIMSTKLYLRLKPPATTQEFFHISVNSSNAGMNVVPKGPIFGGVLRQSETSIIHILYECQIKGQSNVSISIPLLPFNNLQAAWLKDCGGGNVKGLMIGTTSWNRNDVVNDGTAAREWERASRLTANDVKDMVPRVNSTVRFKDFWLTNDGNSIQMDPILVSVEKHDVVSALASITDTQGAVSHIQEGGVLAHNDLLRLRLRMICKKRGQSLIVITIPIKSFRNVEFGLLKECRAPRRFKHSGFLRTADSVVTIVTFFLVFSFLYWWKLYSSRKADAEDTAPLKSSEYQAA
ncbi:hypothetical protein FGB62_17g555 [Gracilaria domingensis]|nr:hypothetical protein FGB62_17g555 [Gracilaria domingensis]